MSTSELKQVMDDKLEAMSINFNEKLRVTERNLDDKITNVEKNLNEKLHSTETNLNLKLQSVKAEVTAGNEMLMMKINEVLCLKGEISSVDSKADTAIDHAKLSDWVQRNYKFSIFILIMSIILLCIIVQAGYAEVVFELFSK